jgi:hypothetical protein
MNQLFLAFLFLLGLQSAAQDIIQKIDSTEKYQTNQHYLPSQKLKSRQRLIGGVTVAGYGGSLFYLNEVWYKGYDKEAFHSFNDSKEWLQMDKVGHAWTAYNTSRASTELWKWAGVSADKAALAGSLTGFSYMTVIEWLDGYSAKWGWSWSDIAANFSGSSLFALQEVFWKEQRIQFKYSAHWKKYDSDVQNRADELFGKSLPERLIKDYNSQTLWLSFNLHSFLPYQNLPPWLNMSIGYGADGMLGGTENKAFDKEGNITFNRADIKRSRQWYFSPDIDFTKIKTNRKAVRTLLAIVNIIKIPAPALEFSKGKLKGRLFSF